MHKIYLFWMLCLPFLVKAQTNFNLTQVANLSYPVDLSNIWGYTAPNGMGTEYALVGTFDGTSIVSLANPASPVEVAFIDGSNSIWRELKVWNNYCYVVADNTRDGILIIDLANLPNSTTHQFYKPLLTVNGQTDTLITGHTLYVEGDYLYVSGSNLNSGGVLIFDIAANPTAPVYLGTASNNEYAHDCYVRGDTLWTADIYAGNFSVYNVSDKTNPIFLANHPTPNNFTHNIWISGDGRTLFTTDEVRDAYVGAYDVSDLSNIVELDRYRSRGTATVGVIPHNVHVLNDFVVTSYYTDGVIVLDGSRPQNMIEVARFDTYNGTNVGFFGDWGVYPYFSSGLMIISDMNTGLHILQPNYQRACWLEGVISEQGTGNLIFNASVQIQSNNINESTDLQGEYRTGTGVAGVYNVLISKAGYQSFATTAQLVSGQVTILNASLVPLAPFTYNAQVLELNNNNPIANAEILLESANGLYQFSTQSDANGNFSINNFYSENYDITIGHWGHQTIVASEGITNSSPNGLFFLEKGYKDEFELDLGWTANNIGATSGDWQRCEPYLPAVYNQMGLMTTPAGDIAGDIGSHCFLTDNNENGQAGAADVDNGVCELISPNMDLSAYNNAYLYFNYWLVNETGTGAANDTLVVTVSNGTNTVEVARLLASNYRWSPLQEFNLSDFIPLSNNMSVSFVISDTGVVRNLVEAGVDNFQITDNRLTNVNEATIIDNQLFAYPNPFYNDFQIAIHNNSQNNPTLQVFNPLGQLIESINISPQATNLRLGQNWPVGIYILKMGNQSQKMIKINP